MTLENTTPSERSQSQRTTYWMIPLYEMSRVDKSIVIENGLMVGWGRGLEGMGDGYGISIFFLNYLVIYFWLH